VTAGFKFWQLPNAIQKPQAKQQGVFFREPFFSPMSHPCRNESVERLPVYAVVAGNDALGDLALDEVHAPCLPHEVVCTVKRVKTVE